MGPFYQDHLGDLRNNLLLVDIVVVIEGIVDIRVAEVVRGHEGPSPKSLDSDENFKPKHTLFCCKLRFVAIYAFYKASFYSPNIRYFVAIYTAYKAFL